MATKEIIELPIFGIRIELNATGASITTNLKDGDSGSEDGDQSYLSEIDGIERLILAIPAMLRSIETAVEGAANNL